MWEDSAYLCQRLIIFLTGVWSYLQVLVPDLLESVQNEPVKQYIQEMSDQKYARILPWLEEI
jgi:hypothetical protein